MTRRAPATVAPTQLLPPDMDGADAALPGADLPPPAELGTGLMVLHSHRAERLLEVVAHWLHQNPLGPLEEEVFIVQSNAVAEWLRMALAQRLGVCAATRVELPGRFFWRLSRLALGRELVPQQSPLDKLPLAWRLMQVLPDLLDDSPGAQAPDALDTWAPLRAFLAADPAQRLWPLCERLADLYDQYQIYRPDWLQGWAQGQRHITDGAGRPVPLDAEQTWQAALWQRLIQRLPPEAQLHTRAVLQQRVVARLQSPGAVGLPLPRRVVAFGMSHLPPGLLEVLAALSAHSQVMLAVPNPCQYHWADVIDGRELLRATARRHRYKTAGQGGEGRGEAAAALPLHALHAHAHPLLAAWGRQSRDFVRLLDAVDDTAAGRGQPGWPRLDLFIDPDDPEDAHPTSLLRQIQNAIRDLQPLAEQRQQPSHCWQAGDRSIVFHGAHSRVRELEVLHDQLLAMLGRRRPGWAEDVQGDATTASAEGGAAPLQPRDVVVMVPDMAPFAPAIQAVFGQFDRNDPRYIPFGLADLGAEAISPLIQVWRWLWRLPSQRAGLSEWLGLLEVPAIQQRFGFAADDVPRLAQWLTGAGLRWGLDPAHRDALGVSGLGDTHTARFALQRMVWGYAVGDVADEAAGQAVADLTGGGAGDRGPDAPEPYADVAGLDAALAGCAAHIGQALQHWWRVCQRPATPVQWVARGHWLVRTFFDGALDSGWDADGSTDEDAALGAGDSADADGQPLAGPRLSPPEGLRWPVLSPADRAAVDALLLAGQQWLEASAQADYDAPIALDVARSAWEQALRLPEADARFFAGGVTFCTLLPMRAIPFRVVCLLGMNDGDYPRRAPRADIDLMARPGMARPGDRSRRDDDRQLMLEALLSARDVLYVSWCSHSERNNAEQPPSVLVAQLRDHLAQGWGADVLDRLTTHHPLQPFSPRYLEGDTQLFTYAHEWHRVHSQIQEHSSPENQAVEPNSVLKEAPTSATAQTPSPSEGAPAPDCTLADLAQALCHPVRAYATRELALVFDQAPELTPDDEPFELDGLARHQLQRELLDPLLDATPTDCTPAAMAQALRQRLHRAARAGQLPLGAPAMVWVEDWVPQLVAAWVAWQAVRAALRQPAPRIRLDGPSPLADWLDSLWLPPGVTDPLGATPREPSQPHLVRANPAPIDPATDATRAWNQLLAAFPGLAGAQQVCRLRSHFRVQTQAKSAEGADGGSDASEGEEPLEASADAEGAVAVACAAHPKKLRPDKLVPLWLRSLALSSVAPDPSHAHVLWVAADATLHAHPLPREQAQAQLAELLAHLHRVRQAPVPLPPQTAWAWLDAGADHPSLLDKLRSAYEGRDDAPGEGVRCPYWSRFFPDLDSLLADGQFAASVSTVWGALAQWLKNQVVVRPHPPLP